MVCCEANDFAALYEGTKQIFGLCKTHGVADVWNLFDTYREFVTSVLRYGDRENLVYSLHSMVWASGQKTLAITMGYDHIEWRSILARKP